MTILKNGADGKDFCNGSIALQQSHFPWHCKELKEGARCSIVPLDRDAEFLNRTAVGASVVEVRVQVRQSGICTVAKDTNLLLLPFLKCGQTIIDSAISEKMKITSSEGSWPAYVDGDTIRIVDCKKQRKIIILYSILFMNC